MDNSIQENQVLRAGQQHGCPAPAMTGGGMPVDMKTEIILGVAGGAIIGLAAGLLLAPQSGKITRGDLKNQMGQLKYRFRRNLDTRVLEPLGNRR